MGLPLVHLGVRARFPSGTAMLEKKRLGHFTYIIFGLEVSEENWGSRARAEDHFLWLTMHILEGHWINAGDIILPTQNMVNRLILRLFIWELFKDYFRTILTLEKVLIHFLGILVSILRHYLVHLLVDFEPQSILYTPLLSVSYAPWE